MSFLARQNVIYGTQPVYTNLTNGYYSYTVGEEYTYTKYFWGVTSAGGSLSPTTIAINGSIYTITSFENFGQSDTGTRAFYFAVSGASPISSETVISSITRSTPAFGTDSISTSSPYLVSFYTEYAYPVWNSTWTWIRNDYVYPLSLNTIPVGSVSQIKIEFPTS